MRAAAVAGWLCLLGCASPRGVGRSFEPSAPPSPAPAIDTGAWRLCRMRTGDGDFSIRLPRGWDHGPEIAGFYPRGTGGDGPYRSTLWVRGRSDYFHQWTQPFGKPAMEGATPREDLVARDYASSSETISGRKATVETRMLVSADPSVPGGLYCAAVTLEVAPGLWLLVTGCVETRSAQEELLAAFRTIDFTPRR